WIVVVSFIGCIGSVIVAYCGFVFNVSLLLQWSSKFSPFKV
ncbi:hypothetical protein M514_13885, partial [Trichuris suis]